MFKGRVTLLLLLFLLVCSFINDCHARTIDELLSNSTISGQDTKKVKDLFESIKKLNVREDEVLLIVDNAVKSNVDAKPLLRILVLISKTAVSDIPTEALINKILEGFAKGAPVDIIIKEAESKVLFLKQAKGVLNYLILKGYEVRKPGMAVNVISIYITKGWEPSELKREIEAGGLTKEEFHELSMFVKKQ